MYFDPLNFVWHFHECSSLPLGTREGNAYSSQFSSSRKDLISFFFFPWSKIKKKICQQLMTLGCLSIIFQRIANLLRSLALWFCCWTINCKANRLNNCKVNVFLMVISWYRELFPCKYVRAFNNLVFETRSSWNLK